jgi:hypothetical protein
MSLVPCRRTQAPPLERRRRPRCISLRLRARPMRALAATGRRRRRRRRSAALRRAPRRKTLEARRSARRGCHAFTMRLHEQLCSPRRRAETRNECVTDQSHGVPAWRMHAHARAQRRRGGGGTETRDGSAGFTARTDLRVYGWQGRACAAAHARAAELSGERQGGASLAAPSLRPLRTARGAAHQRRAR